MLKIKSFTNLFENLNNDLVKCGKLPEHVAYVMDGKRTFVISSVDSTGEKFKLTHCFLLKETVDIRISTTFQEGRPTEEEL